MANSILTEIKKIVGLSSDYTPFDQDIILHINTVFSILNGLGVGPTSGFSIGDSTVTWDDYGAVSGDRNMNSVKTYMSLRVKMFFDPPQTSFVIEAMNKQIEELEWRISVNREGESWTDPNPPPPTFPDTEPPWWEIF